jgi:hypothetical protein
MKSFAIKPPTFGVHMPKAGFAKGKIKMPNAATAPAQSGVRAAKSFGSKVKTFGAGVGAEPATGILQVEHTSKHH